MPYEPSITLIMKKISLIYIRKTISWIREIHATRKLISWMLKNIKVNGDKIHTSVYYKRDDFGFPIANFLWLSGDVPRLLSYSIYVSQLGDALAFLISILKLYKSPLNCLVRYHRENNRSYTWPFYSHVRTFPLTFDHWLTDGRDFMTGLVQTSEDATRSRALILSPLIVSRDFYSLWSFSLLV